MLFNSSEFIFFFVPIVIAVYWFIERWARKFLFIWLTLSSLVFYAWWNPRYLAVLLPSIIINFFIGQSLFKNNSRSRQQQKRVFWIGIIINLLGLSVFKYADFFISNVNFAFKTDLNSLDLLLPLGISFFTFQQISYLIDCYKGRGAQPTFFHYSTYVSFFPQLISGPIIRHTEMLPQLSKKERFVRSQNIVVGISIFLFGLAKKILLADQFALLANPVFDNVSPNIHAPLVETWTGVLAYTLQLYFDFSGYSDMAIGLGKMFGIILPLNFASPYRATSIAEFWQRWHISFSNWLRDYIFFPVSRYLRKRKINRKSLINIIVPPLITMLVSGLWHGSGWTFVFWGLLHGIYLVVAQLFNQIRHRVAPGSFEKQTIIMRSIGWALTFIAVVVGWVFFRAETFSDALTILESMTSFENIQPPGLLFSRLREEAWVLRKNLKVAPINTLVLMRPSPTLKVIFGLALSIWLPNIKELFKGYQPTLKTRKYERDENTKISWRPSVTWGIIMAILFVLSVSNLLVEKDTHFIYSNF